jgi:serine/threonine protein kinase
METGGGLSVNSGTPNRISICNLASEILNLKSFHRETDLCALSGFDIKWELLERTISHYRILQRLGAGGMGEVYLAEDTRLDRKVAIKFVRSALEERAEIRKRLIREAKAAAKLEHPNIC